MIVPPKLATFVEAEFPPSEVEGGQGRRRCSSRSRSTRPARWPPSRCSSRAGPAFDVAGRRRGEAVRVRAGDRRRHAHPRQDRLPLPVHVHREARSRSRPPTSRASSAIATPSSPWPTCAIALDTGQEAVTDEQGKFKILDIAPGEHLVTLSGESLATVGTTETFEASKKIDATYEVDKKKESGGGGDEDEEIVVTAPRLKKQVVSTEVQADAGDAQGPRHAGRRAQGRREPARRRARRGGLGRRSSSGARRRRTRASTSTACTCRASTTAAGTARSCPRTSSSPWSSSRAATARATAAGSAASSPSRCGPSTKRASTAASAADMIDASADVRAKLSDRVHVARRRRERATSTRVLASVTSEDVGDIVPIPALLGRAGPRSSTTSAPHETIEVGGARLERPHRATRSSTPTRRSPRSRRRAPTSSASTSATRSTSPTARSSTVVPSFGYTTRRAWRTRSARSSPTPRTTRRSSASAPTGMGRCSSTFAGAVGLDVEMVASSLHRDGSIGAPPREGDVYVFGQPPPARSTPTTGRPPSARSRPTPRRDFSLVRR